MGSVGGGGAGLVSGDGSGRFSVAARSRSIAAFPAVLIPARALGFGDVGGCWPQAVPHHMTAIIPVSMMKRRVRRVRLFRDPKPGWCWILSFARSGTAGMSDKAMGRRAGGAETGCWCGRDIGQIRSRMIRRVMLVPTAWHNREGSKLPLWCWGDPCAPIGVPAAETGQAAGQAKRFRIPRQIEPGSNLLEPLKVSIIAGQGQGTDPLPNVAPLHAHHADARSRTLRPIVRGRDRHNKAMPAMSSDQGSPVPPPGRND